MSLLAEMPNSRSPIKYSISFTAGSLLYEETTRLLNHILNDELEERKHEIIKDNIIKINSESARKRVLQEIKKRFGAVSKSVWVRYENSNIREQKILLFYTVLKTYPILADFMKEVVVYKWKSLKKDLTARDIELFLDRKSAEHPEIEKWADTTKEKVIQVVQRILKESGILINFKLNALESSEQFWRFFIQLDDPWFLEYALLNKEQRNKIIEYL